MGYNKDHGSNFDQIIAIARDLRKEPRSEFAHAIKTCAHRNTIFEMRKKHRREQGRPYVSLADDLSKEKMT